MLKNIIKWQTASSVIVFLIGLLQMIALARLLDLSDFGLVAITMVVVNICQVFSDLGMSNYLVHRQKISQTLNSTVFWICFCSGVFFFSIISLTSPLIGAVYGNQGVVDLLTLAAFSFIPISLSSQLQARYISEFKLNLLAKFNVIAALIGMVVAIVSAFLGIGAASIVLAGVTNNLIKCILMWVYSKREWRPKLVFCIEEAKFAWKYGVYQVGSQLINQVRANLDTLLLGFYIDNNQLGAYTLAKQLIQKPTALILPIIRNVTLPLLASTQDSVRNMAEVMKKSHTYVSILIIFPYLLLCTLSKEVIEIMYGLDKIEVAKYILPLSLYWMFRTIGGALVAPICQGLGKTKIDFYWNVSVLLIFTFLCYIIAPHGGYYLAWGLAVLQLILMNVVYYVFYWKVIKFKYSWYINPVVISIANSVISVGIPTLIILLTPFVFGNWFKLLFISLLSSSLYYLLNYKTQRNNVYIPNLVPKLLNKLN